MTDYDIAKTLDVRGLTCPLVVVRAKKAITEVEPGQVLEVLSTDPASKSDIPAWTKRVGHELLESLDEGELFKFYVRRGP